MLYIGVSEWRAEEISAALAIADRMGLDRIVSNQPQYNMLWRVIESEVLPLCMKEGIGQIVWSPIAQGALTGKYQPGQSVPAGSRATDESGSGFIRGYLTDAILSRVAELRPVAEEAGLSMAQLAIAWVLQNPGVSAAIIGATRPERNGCGQPKLCTLGAFRLELCAVSTVGHAGFTGLCITQFSGSVTVRGRSGPAGTTWTMR